MAWYHAAHSLCHCVTSLCTVLGSIALCVHCYELHYTNVLLALLDRYELHLTVLISTMSTGNLYCTPDSTFLLCRRCKHSTRQQPIKPSTSS